MKHYLRRAEQFAAVLLFASTISITVSPGVVHGADRMVLCEAFMTGG